MINALREFRKEEKAALASKEEEKSMSKYVKPEGTVQFFLDESAPGEKFRGEPPLTSADEMRQFCPKCFKEITNEGPGYGLAFGGMGTYWICGNEDCDWFYKIMDCDKESTS